MFPWRRPVALSLVGLGASVISLPSGQPVCSRGFFLGVDWCAVLALVPGGALLTLSLLQLKSVSVVCAGVSQWPGLQGLWDCTAS